MDFSGALSAWQDINLSGMQPTLDAQGVQLVQNQKDSLVGRKALADRTKEFKKLPEESKPAEYQPLLKAYQIEIDGLTKRSKAAESAFLALYKVLAEAPDPYPLLEAAVAHASQAPPLATSTDLEDKIIDLTKRLEDSDARMKSLETQLSDTSTRETAASQKLASVIAREAELTAQLRTANTRLLEASDRAGEDVVRGVREADMLLDDLERANARVAAAEHRNEQLRSELEAARVSSPLVTSQADLELRQENKSLSSSLSTTRALLEAQKSTTQQIQLKLAESARLNTRRESEIASLKDRLHSYRDYDELKRELEIMKFVEFSVTEAEAEAGYEAEISLPDPNAAKANARHGRSLEALLATKTKRLEEELTRFRVQHGALTEALHTTQSELAAAKADVDRMSALVDRLEADLLAVEQRQNGMTTVAEKGKSRANDEDDILASLNLGKRIETSRTATPLPSSADTSILPIVTGQRDRFRQRNAELEEELRRQFTTLSSVRAEAKSLQADNLKLYEKVRYMQSYRSEASSSSVLTGDAPSRKAEDKYRARYEESMNPFEAFRGREATRAIQALNPVERGVLILTRAILGNRRARAAFIFYAATLHLLVMFTTYSFLHDSTNLESQPLPYNS